MITTAFVFQKTSPRSPRSPRPSFSPYPLYYRCDDGTSWCVHPDDENDARMNLGMPVRIEIKCPDDQFAYMLKSHADDEHTYEVHDSCCSDSECEATGLVLFDKTVLAMVDALIEYERGRAVTSRAELLEDHATSLPALLPLIDRYCAIKGFATTCAECSNVIDEPKPRHGHDRACSRVPKHLRDE